MLFSAHSSLLPSCSCWVIELRVVYHLKLIDTLSHTPHDPRLLMLPGTATMTPFICRSTLRSHSIIQRFCDCSFVLPATPTALWFQWSEHFVVKSVSWNRWKSNHVLVLYHFAELSQSYGRKLARTTPPLMPACLHACLLAWLVRWLADVVDMLELQIINWQKAYVICCCGSCQSVMNAAVIWIVSMR